MDLHELLHELTDEEVSEIEKVFESKDVGRFAGEISDLKRQTRDLNAGKKRPTEKASKKQLDKLVTDLQRDMESYLKKFKDGSLSKTAFRNKMKAALKFAYQDAYHLGAQASGMGQLSTHTSDDEKKFVANAWSREQTYFNTFLDNVAAGESLTKSEKRIASYANAIRAVYDSSIILQSPDGYAYYWVLESNNPCSECRLLHRMSPFTRETLPTTPKSGRTRCLANCKCVIRQEKAPSATLQSIMRKNKSAEYLLRQLVASRKKK